MMPMKISLGCRPRSGVAGRYHRNWIGRRGWRCRNWRGMRAQGPQVPTSARSSSQVAGRLARPSRRATMTTGGRAGVSGVRTRRCRAGTIAPPGIALRRASRRQAGSPGTLRVSSAAASVCLVWAVLMRRQAGNQPVPATVCSAPVTTASF